ncbi:MAG: glycerophosphodiester phosphodiesterase ['Candidatus Kapabacteria' thiocyanatum]|uniref:GP-PDE domain-containing protein n=1 Tax=Candidatus Kapaibacterium thiocyanatum TaxID=1895771 RepID=A0A1M3L0C6_9BACT|nr:glycerophosphodiester phosphodiesterase ['Candidatus Kapabacteria' thiocyanatum]OJX58283.1 MAG: hypothetical protein BGO89_03375 ['Candidatus Kapabacteria' thiocyanatum]
MSGRIVRWLLPLVVLAGCVTPLEDILDPAIDLDDVEASVTLLDTTVKEDMGGVYSVEEGQQQFGDTIALRWNARDLSGFGTRNVCFLTMRGGVRGDTGVIEGTWRFTTGSSTGIIRLRALPDEGGRALSGGTVKAKDIVWRGTWSGADGANARPLVLRGKRALFRRPNGFSIIAHRGGGRNSERYGVSENSLEMMRLASRLGATGIEIDVHRTRDDQAIIFHDPTFTPRTIRGAYVLGDVENYTLRQIKAVARLVNGEQIPTLEEALRTVIDETPLEMVWLDIKAETIIDSIIAVQKRMMEYAVQQRRTVKIYLGIPTSEVRDAYLASPLRGAVPVLCELDANSVRAVDAAVWAPRFTAGLQLDVVKQMHREQRRVYVWTLDDPNFMRSFLTDGDFDGVLTNYPMLLAAIFYTRAL